MTYATFDQALDHAELGVSGVTSYGSSDRETMTRERLLYELCEWHDRDGAEFQCWVVRYLENDTWDYLNEDEARSAGLAL